MNKRFFQLDRYKVAILFVLAIFLGLIVVLYSSRKELGDMCSEAARERRLENFQKAIDIYKQINVKYHGTREAEESVLMAAEIYYFNISNYRLAIDFLERLIDKGEYPEYIL
jgi:outer membrane protein assembly factor BamD (BamD/ComL family)